MISLSLSLSDGFHLFSFIFFFAAQSAGHEVWNAMFDLVKNVSEVMMSALPNFWKIAKGFFEGKYKKVLSPLFKLCGPLNKIRYGDIERPPE
jgi:hypothetical protein